MRRKLVLMIALLTASASSAWAGYTVGRSDGRPNVVFQGKQYTFVVQQTGQTFFDDVYVQVSGPTSDSQVIVGPGTQTGLNPPKYRVNSSGNLNFNITFFASGNHQITVTNSVDGQNFITTNFVVEAVPVSFQITPPSPTVNVNQPFTIQVKAVDASNNWVTSFDDPIQIQDQQLGQITAVPASDFLVPGSEGVASVSLTIQAGNLNNQTRLNVDLASGIHYFTPAQAPDAHLTSGLINVVPGAFAQVLMLFPGEILNPGFPKNSANISTQTVNVNVQPDVKVYMVDSFFNPILTPPASPVALHFTSSFPTDDTLPPDNSYSSFPVSFQGNGATPFTMGSFGNHVITCIPNADATLSDFSQVPVSAGGAASYTLDLVPALASYTIGQDIIHAVITAYTLSGTVQVGLNGPLAGAELRAAGSSGDSKQYVDTNPALNSPQPDNVVNFVKGVATVNLIVTERNTTTKLHFIDALGKDVFSVPFRVLAGGPTNLMLTVRGTIDPNTKAIIKPGENELAGIFNTVAGGTGGNRGTLPQIVAGEEMAVEASVTDIRWNLSADGTNNGKTVSMISTPGNYIDALTPPGPVQAFAGAQDQFAYTTDSFDQSFKIIFRTAGVNRQITANSNIGTSGPYKSSMFTVVANTYNKLAIVAPGETLDPGTTIYASGKAPTPGIQAQGAGTAFPVNVIVGDQYFNPVAGGFPLVKLDISPSRPGQSFINDTSGNPVPLGTAFQLFKNNTVFNVTLASGSVVTVTDASDASKTQSVIIPIGAGALDHFAMDVVPTPQAAGVAFTTTIRALDQYNNVVPQNMTVTLTPNTGAGTMSPTTISLTNGISVSPLNLTMFAATTTAKITMSNAGFPSALRTSNGFTVNVSPNGYQKLMLLLPGENLFPGTLAGKTGSPTPTTAGFGLNARVIACDQFYNPLDVTPGTSVTLSSNHLVVFSPSATGAFQTVNGHGEYVANINFKNATTHTVQVQDLNNDATITRSTSTIQVTPAGYQQLQILAVGENNNPDSLTGKSGTPSTGTVATPYNLVINAVDSNWNIVSNFNGGDINLAANISATLFLPPNSPDSGVTNPRPFVNGSSTRQAVIGLQGSVTLTASDDINLTKAGNSVTITINPGPGYRFQTPVSAVVGQPFAPVTISLENNGIPVSGYNRSIFLTATLPTGGSASGMFNPDGTPREYVMNNGVVTINDLSYAYSENIEIKLTDEFARIGFSNAIDVVPSGLNYQVVVPTTSVVGPPTTFPVTVRLVDSHTGTLVKNHDHKVNIAVVSADNPTTTGSAGVNGGLTLSQGMVTFNQSYTKAENITMTISEDPVNGDPTYTIPDGHSLPVSMTADNYKKLLLLAPNEVQVPGVISATGKTGNPANAQKDIAFLMQVRGVDQFWNTAIQFNGGSIVFDSNDRDANGNPSINNSNPTNQGASLANGASASNIKLLNPGDTQVTIRDASNSAITIQSDVIRVGGLYYQVDGEPAQQFTGAGFNISVTLFDSNTSLPVTSANQVIQIKAKLQNGEDATGLLGVTSAQLSNGTANIVGENYSIAENVYLNVTDAQGNSGSSDVIVFVPRKINYVITTPLEAIVNQPFAISVKAIDAFTGTDVKNLNGDRVIGLSALSGLTGLPVTGSFLPTSILISSGSGTANPIYTIAEPIAIQVTDNTPPTSIAAPQQSTYTQQGTINIHPGPLATIDGIQDFRMQSNEERTFLVTARDMSGNPIPSQRIKFAVSQIGAMSINSNTDVAVIQANGQGQMTVRFTPTGDANGRIEVTMSDADVPNGYATLLDITVLGITRRPAGALDIGANRIPINSRLPLAIGISAAGALEIRTFYRLGDSGAFQPYDPNVKASGFTETKTYTVEWYSEACYDVLCSTPVMEFTDPNTFNRLEVTTYRLDDSISAYPNPFNPKAGNGENYITIQYPLAQASSVEINIYDLMGQKVWHKDIDAGASGGEARVDNRVFWFGTNDNGMVVANGGYITTVKVGSTGQTMKTKILVVK